MAIVRPLGATSSSSKSNGFLDDAWDFTKDVAKGAAKGAAGTVAKKFGAGGPPPPPPYQPPPPEPKKEAFHETTLGKLAILAGITKLLKVW